jgi:hypothetical protein
MSNEPVDSRCKNCLAPLLGRYCGNCGQAAGLHVPSTKELLHELLEGVTHSDSRLWRTLVCLWFKPGKLTLEFVAGRRISYLPPFRLYLVLSVIFFLIAPLSHSQIISFDDKSEPGVSPASHCADINIFGSARYADWNQRLKHGCEESVRDNGVSLVHVAIATLPKAMFIFLPLLAFFNMLMYWRPRYRYAEHLLFFVHLHAFFFSVAILLVLAGQVSHAWPILAPGTNIITALLGWSLPIYGVVALRRVFGTGWVGTLFKAAALSVVYILVLSITVAGVFLYAMLQL